MKKIAFTIVILLVLSFSIFADGEFPAGGKSCPNGQATCLASMPEPTNSPAETVFKKVLVFLRSFFG